ncbi:MAG: NlpC/P60 family protein [Burkholderiales bacterium]
MNHRHRTACTLLVALLAGCAHAPERGAPGVTYATGARIDLGNSELVKKNLYAQYRQWKGTKYKIGGLSRKGIDCSGFVYVTFKSKLGIVLPRSTELQAEAGKSIGKGQLRTGDLVFFKTGIFIRHVGVYLERGRFLHASTTLGVMISQLDDDYWKSAYWKARRIET